MKTRLVLMLHFLHEQLMIFVSFKFILSEVKVKYYFQQYLQGVLYTF